MSGPPTISVIDSEQIKNITILYLNILLLYQTVHCSGIVYEEQKTKSIYATSVSSYDWTDADIQMGLNFS